MRRSTKLFTVLFGLFAGLFTHGTNAQVWGAIEQYGGNGSQLIVDMATDNSGNTFITGRYNGNFSMGSVQDFNNSENDAFLAKRNSQGDFEWVRRITSTSENNTTAVEVGPSGNIYVIGNYSAEATFHQPGSNRELGPTSSGNQGIFIAQYNQSGQLVSGGNSLDIQSLSNNGIILSGNSLSVNANGEVFGCGSVVFRGGRAGILFRAGFNNYSYWQNILSNNLRNTYVDLYTVHTNNNAVYVGGGFEDIVKFNRTDSVFALGDFDAILVEYGTTNGSLQQGLRWGESGSSSSVNEIKTNDNSLFVKGVFDNGIRLSPSISFNSNDNDFDGFLLSLTTNYGLKWSKTFKGDKTTRVSNFTFDNQDNVHLIGRSSGTYNYDGGQTISAPQNDSLNIFYQEISSDGNHKNILAAEGTGIDWPSDIEVTNNGDLLVSGYFRSKAQFPTSFNDINNPGIFDGFLVDITDKYLAADYSFGELCPNTDQAITRIAHGDFQSGNEFIAEISDNTGDFSNATEIGKVEAQSSGTMTINIPQNVKAASGYKIRLKASNPQTTGNEGKSFDVLAGPIVDNIDGKSDVESGETNTYTVEGNQGSNYDWLINNGVEKSQDSNSIEVLWEDKDRGMLKVIETTTDGCKGDTVSKKVFINATNSVEANAQVKDLNIYPNPASDQLRMTIDLKTRSQVTISLMNSSGKQILRKNKGTVSGELAERLNLSPFNPGVYMLRIQTGEYQINRRIMVR